MKETTLRFLMNDGAGSYTFRPGLTPEQYAELDRLVRQQHSTPELNKALKAVATEHGLTLSIDAA